MKRGRLLILLIAFASLAQAQDLLLDYSSKGARKNAIDSIHRILSREERDTAKARLMRLLASRYSFIDRDSSIGYYRQALAIYQRAKEVNGQVRTLAETAQELAQTGSYAQALTIALKARQMAEQSKDTLNLILATRAVWRSYFFMDEFSMCLEYARRVKVLVHSGFFKNEKETKSYALFGYLNGMSDAFLGLNKPDSTFYYGRLALETANSLMDPQHLAIINVRMGHIHSKMGKLDSAFFYFHAGVPLAMRVNRDDLVAWAYLGMAKLYTKEAKTDSALHYGGLALRGYQRIKQPLDELETASFLTDVYAKENRIDSAYKYQSMSLSLKDSLFNQEKVKGVQNLQFGETLRIQQLEQERKEAQQQYATRMKIYGLLAIVAIVLVIAFFLYRNNKIKQRTNAQLHEQKQRVEDAYAELKAAQAQLVQREKMASLGELTAGIAHEIQNPLNFMNNFSEVNNELIAEMQQELKAGHIDDAFALSNDIQENESKISHHGKRADAIVKSMMEHSRTAKGERQSTDINALIDEYMRLAYHGFRAKDKGFNTDFSTHFDPAVGKLNVVPQEIGRVLLNLLNNAFYAVQKKKEQLNGTFEPVVSVSTKKQDNYVEITVKDNGTGIAQQVKEKIFQPFFTTKPTGEGTGLGLSLSYDIVTKQHGGRLDVLSEEGAYAEFVITLPIQKHFQEIKP